MAEELRFFLRVAAYGLLITVVYWFLSYEVPGTLLLLAVALASAFFLAFVGAHVRAARSEVVPRGRGARRLLETGNRLIGFEEHAGEVHAAPLATSGDEPVVTASPWPILAATAAVLVALGLIYGPWLTAPGIVLAGIVVWGWVTQLHRGRAR